MEIFIHTSSGEIICCKSLILGEERDGWVVSNESRLRIAVSSKEACDKLIARVWELIRAADQANRHSIFITVT